MSARQLLQASLRALEAEFLECEQKAEEARETHAFLRDVIGPFALDALRHGRQLLWLEQECLREALMGEFNFGELLHIGLVLGTRIPPELFPERSVAA